VTLPTINVRCACVDHGAPGRRLALEGLQEVADYGDGEGAGDAGDGGGAFLDEAAEVEGGLVLLVVEEVVVFVEDAAVVSGEDDPGGEGDEVAGGLAGGGVVGEGGDDFGEDGAVESGVGGGCVGLEDVIFGASVELADDGLGEGDFSVVGLDAGGEDGDSEGADVGRDLRCGAGLVVAAAGGGQEWKQKKWV